MIDSTDRPATPLLRDAGDLAWLGSAAGTLRQRWWLVAGCALALLVAAVFYLRTAEYSYSVVLRVSPAASAATARDSGALGALGNLAALTGIGVGAIPATPFRLYVDGWRSQAAAACVARDPAVLRGVFRTEWQADRQQWQAPHGLGDRLRAGLNDLAAAPDPGWSPPDARRLQRELATLVTIDQTNKSAVTAITIDAVDPAFGVRLLQSLHLCVDDLLRQRALERSRQNIAYLQSRLNFVAVADHRQILIATLADQQQRLTVLSNPAPYAAEPFGAIVVSPQPTRPRPLPIVIAALALGLGLGVVLALLIPRRRPV
ncbi:MAG: hypothetical protein RL490_1763 [Pseudomonadota bacterium]